MTNNEQNQHPFPPITPNRTQLAKKVFIYWGIPYFTIISPNAGEAILNKRKSRLGRKQNLITGYDKKGKWSPLTPKDASPALKWPPYTKTTRVDHIKRKTLRTSPHDIALAGSWAPSMFRIWRSWNPSRTPGAKPGSMVGLHSYRPGVAEPMFTARAATSQTNGRKEYPYGPRPGTPLCRPLFSTTEEKAKQRPQKGNPAAGKSAVNMGFFTLGRSSAGDHHRPLAGYTQYSHV